MKSKKMNEKYEGLIPERLVNQFKNLENPCNFKNILSRVSLTAGVAKNIDKKNRTFKRK